MDAIHGVFRGSALLDEQAVLSWNDLHLDVGIHAKAVSEWLGNGDLSSVGDSHGALGYQLSLHSW